MYSFSFAQGKDGRTSNRIVIGNTNETTCRLNIYYRQFNWEDLEKKHTMDVIVVMLYVVLHRDWPERLYENRSLEKERNELLL